MLRFASAPYLLAGAVLIGAAAAQTVIQPATSIAPTGIGATATQLLFSQPFGSGASQARGIYSVTNISGTGSVLSASIQQIISLPTVADSENQFAISLGQAGFTAGDVFSTNPSTATTDAVSKNGAPFIIGIPDQSPGRAGILFDTVGTFGNAMIVTTPSGIFGFNSGAALLFAYPAPAGFLLESGQVAPLTNAACPGCLYVTSESIAAETGQGAPNGAIYAIKPNTPSGTSPTLIAQTPGLAPESIQFVPPDVCTLNGTSFSYFVAAYAAGSQIATPNSTSGALLAYTQAQVTPFAGQALVTIDGRIVAFNPLSNAFTPFSTPTPVPAANPPVYQLEAASIIGGGCTTVPTAPPTIAKMFGTASVPPNGNTTLSFTIKNPNISASLSGIGFADNLPGGLLVATPTGLTGSCGGGTITATAGSSTVSLAGVTLAAGASCTFSVNVIGATEGVKVNTTGPVTSIEGGNGTPASATLRVVSPPTLTKAFADSQIQLLGPSSTALSFTLTNPNQITTLTGLSVTDTSPSGLIVSTPNGLTGSCGGTITATAGSNSISLSGGTLAAGASCTFSVNVTGTAIGVQTNTTSTVTSNEAAPGAPATATTSVDFLYFYWFFAA
jgi:hypothetical protein